MKDKTRYKPLTEKDFNRILTKVVTSPDPDKESLTEKGQCGKEGSQTSEPRPDSD